MIDCTAFKPLRKGGIAAFPAAALLHCWLYTAVTRAADRGTLLAATFDGGDVGGPA